jgi:hypothetical protein
MSPGGEVVHWSCPNRDPVDGQARSAYRLLQRMQWRRPGWGTGGQSARASQTRTPVLANPRRGKPDRPDTLLARYLTPTLPSASYLAAPYMVQMQLASFPQPSARLTQKPRATASVFLATPGCPACGREPAIVFQVVRSGIRQPAMPNSRDTMSAFPSPEELKFRGSTAHDWAVIMRRRRELQRAREVRATLRASIQAPDSAVSDNRVDGGCLIPPAAPGNAHGLQLSGPGAEDALPPESRRRDEPGTTQVGARVAWTPIDDRMPPEGVVVETDSADGRRHQLKWQGRLWRYRDESHHLFYTPLYWRPVAGLPPDAPRPEPMAARSIGPGLLTVLAWMAGVGAAAVAAHRFSAPASTVWQVALAVLLAAVPLTLLYGGVFGWARRRPV